MTSDRHARYEALFVFLSRAHNLCDYRLHGGLSSHTHQVCGAIGSLRVVGYAVRLQAPRTAT
jgi:hypothetical protein